MFARRFAFGLSIALPIALPIALAGCGAPPVEEPASTLDDALSQQDFDTTVKNLASLPWLPWTYLTDGCYARAFYYSMLLASKDVPTNHLYVRRRPGAPPLFGIWEWHVAPVVTKDGDPNHLYVLDPAYDQTKALTNVEWVAKQNYADPNASNYPRLGVAAGNSYLVERDTSRVVANPGSPDAAAYKEPIIAEMPAFPMGRVGSACNVMHDYIDRENGTTSAMKAEKHRSLGKETQRLVAELRAKSKISGTDTLSNYCTRNQPEPEKQPDPTFVDPSRRP